MVVNFPIKNFDVVLIADMNRSGDVGLRIRHEIQALYELGLDVGLLHLPVKDRTSFSSADIADCIRTRQAKIIFPDDQVTAELAIVYSPSAFKKPEGDLSRINAEKVVLVHDRRPNPEQMGQWFSFSVGRMQWAPTNRWNRSALANLNQSIPLTEEDWRPIARAVRPQSPLRGKRQFVVGRVSVPGAAQWPEGIDALETVYPRQSHYDFRVLGAPDKDLLKELGSKKNWIITQPGDIAVYRFLEGLDAFMYFPRKGFPELPETAIATAMASGKPVILPERFKPHFGPGPVYTDPEHALTRLREMLEHPERMNEITQEARHHVKFQFSEQTYKEKILRLLGKEAPQRGRKITTKRVKKLLFVPSNGVGLGHVTRTLSIARRLNTSLRAHFFTLAQATSIIENFGFPAEYFTSQTDSGSSLGTWDLWLRQELSIVLERLGIDGLVFDGNHPSPGIVNAALTSGDCRMVWIRRGMLGETEMPFIENSRFFDLIIEPQDLAEESDHGVTATRRHETLRVGPITLLDQNELLSAKEARKQLGLDQNRPAVLLQLGAGKNRNIVDLADKIIQKLRGFSQLQIVVADWANGAVSMPRWPGTSTLKGYPLSRFFNAFDFSISAAGYNSFHEAISFGLPTVFFPNQHPSMDDQTARADLAQANSAGFFLDEEEIFHLPALTEALMNEKVRNVVASACATLSRPNGAQAAADAIGELMRE